MVVAIELSPAQPNTVLYYLVVSFFLFQQTPPSAFPASFWEVDQEECDWPELYVALCSAHMSLKNSPELS